MSDHKKYYYLKMKIHFAMEAIIENGRLILIGS
ncbi:hypothetical protein EV214_13527 [Marinisporobacter balticus]|uniref:Uncharacterized protein n=1 Tax=Marinisporobacter balticus TaxID=2018667 RepID=A0A4R2KR37_9FIRM|nr:hypothetical protein EV214_13527 [Marinisporobacter balticus]